MILMMATVVWSKPTEAEDKQRSVTTLMTILEPRLLLLLLLFYVSFLCPIISVRRHWGVNCSGLPKRVTPSCGWWHSVAHSPQCPLYCLVWCFGGILRYSGIFWYFTRTWEHLWGGNGSARWNLIAPNSLQMLSNMQTWPAMRVQCAMPSTIGPAATDINVQCVCSCSSDSRQNKVVKLLLDHSLVPTCHSERFHSFEHCQHFEHWRHFERSKAARTTRMRQLNAIEALD